MLSITCKHGWSLAPCQKTVLKIPCQPTALQNLMIGGASRTLAGSILLPFTVIKARYESGFFGYTGVTNAFFAIYRQEGVRGLWSGMCATVLRDAPFSGKSYTKINHRRLRSKPSPLPLA